MPAHKTEESPLSPAAAPPEAPGDEEVRYDLAGNPLPPRPKAATMPAAPVAAPTGGFLAAPSFAPPPAYTPPPGFVTPPGAAPPGKSAPSGRALYGGLAGAALVLVALIFIVRALRPVTVTAPTAYKTYTAIDNTFSCDQPAGWTMHETGATSGVLSTATFEKAHVRFRVVSDSVGSLMGDIATANNNAASSIPLPPDAPPPPPPKPAVEQLHERDKSQLADGLPGYQEGPMQTLATRVGDSRLSEWTADGGKMHGYRVTMLGNQREITVICLAPERNWAILQPAFQHMIASVAPGNG